MEPKPKPSRCPSCKAALRPDDAVCAACGANVLPVALSTGEEIQERPTDDAPPAVRVGRRRRDDEDRPRRRRRDDDDDYDDPSRFRRRNEPDPALGVFVPINQSALAVLSGYAGLFSCFPFIGLLLGPLAILLGILAMRAINRDPERRVGGAYRAIIGIILGVINTLISGALTVAVIVANVK